MTAAGGRSAERLLGVVDEVCAMVAELDPELLAPAAEARPLVVMIAEIARLATAELGEPVGARFHAGPGIVLQRELAASARALERAVGQRAGDCEQRLVARAQTTRALLRDVLTADG